MMILATHPSFSGLKAARTNLLLADALGQPDGGPVAGSDAALSSNRRIGRVDGGDFLGRDGHKFRRDAARDHLVRVIVDDELPIVNFQRIIADVGRYAQNLIRIALG